MLKLGLGGKCQYKHGQPEKAIDKHPVIQQEQVRELNIIPDSGSAVSLYLMQIILPSWAMGMECFLQARKADGPEGKQDRPASLGMYPCGPSKEHFYQA